jgi:hypothetical protein
MTEDRQSNKSLFPSLRHFVHVAIATVPFMIDHLLSPLLRTEKQFGGAPFQVVQ